MWNVKDGRLFCGGEEVAVRRVVVERVMGRRKEPPTGEMVRDMLRMERALSLLGLSAGIGGGGEER